MSRNGSGVYSPSATGYPAVASTTIESAKYNAVLADIATALTGSIACNGESTITGNIPLAGYKITGLGNASSATDALNLATADARYAALAGGTFTGQVTISASDPILWINESDAAADEKKWALRALNGDFLLLAYNDAVSSGSTPMAIARTGTTIDSINFVSTAIAVNTIDITPTEGSFTVYLRATDGGANITSGTATWKKSNGIVTLFLPSLTASSAVTDPLFLDGFPAAISPVSAAQYLLAPGYDAGAETIVKVTVPVSGDYLTFRPFDSSTFTAGASTKGIVSTTLVWTL